MRASHRGAQFVCHLTFFFPISRRKLPGRMTSCWRKTPKSKLFRARIAVFKLRPVLVSSYSLFVLRFFPYCPGVYSQGQQISGLMGYSYFSRIQVRTYIASFAGREESEAQSETQTERYLLYGANLVSGI